MFSNLVTVTETLVCRKNDYLELFKIGSKDVVSHGWVGGCLPFYNLYLVSLVKLCSTHLCSMCSTHHMTCDTCHILSLVTSWHLSHLAPGDISAQYLHVVRCHHSPPAASLGLRLAPSFCSSGERGCSRLAPAAAAPHCTFPHIFVQIAKYICPDSQIDLSK